jgi:hypothetical protein
MQGNNKTSIPVDASKYIKELKDKVEEAAAASQADSSATSGNEPWQQQRYIHIYIHIHCYIY